MIDINKIRARVDAATPGKWDHDGYNCVSIYNEKGNHDLDICECEDICTENAEANAEFIAHAREDIPALIAEVERLQAELQKETELRMFFERASRTSGEHEKGCEHCNDETSLLIRKILDGGYYCKYCGRQLKQPEQEVAK